MAELSVVSELESITGRSEKWAALAVDMIRTWMDLSSVERMQFKAAIEARDHQVNDEWNYDRGPCPPRTFRIGPFLDDPKRSGARILTLVRSV